MFNCLQLQLQAAAFMRFCMRSFLVDPPEHPAHRLRPRVDITHRGLDGVVPGDVVQRKSVRMLSRLGQKCVAEGMQSGIQIEPNLIMGKLFPEPSISDLMLTLEKSQCA
jgi:hypothetical protein